MPGSPSILPLPCPVPLGSGLGPVKPEGSQHGRVIRGWLPGVASQWLWLWLAVFVSVPSALGQ